MVVLVTCAQIVTSAHVAAHAGVLHHFIMRTRLTFHAFATGTEQDIALNAQVCIEAR